MYSRIALYILVGLAGLLFAVMVNGGTQTTFFLEGERVSTEQMTSRDFWLDHVEDVETVTTLDYDHLFWIVSQEETDLLPELRFRGDVQTPSRVIWGVLLVHPLLFALLFAGFLRALEWIRRR